MYKTPLPNVTINQTEGVYHVNQSYHVSFYERYFQNPLGSSVEGSIYLYILFGVLVALLAYVAVRFYLDLRAARERKKLKEMVEKFDKKLEEDLAIKILDLRRKAYLRKLSPYALIIDWDITKPLKTAIAEVVRL